MSNGKSENILVTGHTGFVGTYLLKEEKVVAFEDKQGRIDLADVERIREFIASVDFKYVIHLAAQSHVPTAINNPVETINTNLIGTINLLSALESADFDGRFLYVSSGDVYGRVDPSNLPIIESLPVKPGNPYALSLIHI